MVINYINDPGKKTILKKTGLMALNLVNVLFFFWLLTELHFCQIGKPFGVCPFITNDIVTVLVGFGFFLTAAFSIIQNRPSIESLYFIWAAGVLFTGIISATLTVMDLTLFNIYLIFEGPIHLHFNLSLLDRKLRKTETYSLIFFYILAIILAILCTFSMIPLSYPNGLYGILKSVNRIFFVAAVIWTLYLLWEGYNHFSSLTARRRIRLMVNASFLAVTPLIFLTALPQALGIKYIIPIVNFPPLLLIPLLYLYITFRSRFSFPENTFRGILVYFILAVLYLAIFLFTIQTQNWIPLAGLSFYPFLASTFIMLVTFMPLRKRLYNWVDWVFYGSDTDYQAALIYLEDLLASVLDRGGIVYLLLDELISAIKPTQAILFLRKQENLLVYSGGQGLVENPFAQITLNTESPLSQFLAKLSKPVSSSELKTQYSQKPINSDEMVLLSNPQVALWIPLVSEEVLQGLVFLSLRAGDDLYTEKDKFLLSNLIPKAGAAIRNIILAEGILAGKEELAQAHYQLITNQEEEHKRIARELHDDTIQRLIGISYQIADVKKQMARNADEAPLLFEDRLKELEEVRDHLSDTVAGIRRLINELRPAGLEEFGIRITLENMVEQFRQKMGARRLEFILDIEPDLDNLPELQSICIYRISQEAIRNIIKHADASRILIELSQKSDQVNLYIEDNGRGFNVPERLSELAMSNHFGLVGIQERANSIGGVASVLSIPGKGTKINILLPVNERVKSI